MKVCFVNLPTPYSENQFSDPPLGLLYTMAVTKEEHEVLFLDLADIGEATPKADIYGISSTTMAFPLARSVAKHIKKIFPDSFIVLGGVHPTLYRRTPKDSDFNIYYRGEGESFNSLLELIEGGFSYGDFQAQIQKDLDSIPFPAREFLSKKYFSNKTIFRGSSFFEGNSTTIITSRGCPYACSFCASPKLWERKVRWRSPENVLEEIDILIEKYNVHELRFQDDNLTLDVKRLEKLCKGLQERKVFWRCSTRTNLVNPHLLEVLWNGGCREIGFGIESSENTVLSKINKNLTVETQKSGLSMTKNFGFRVRVFLMTGLPGETKDSANKTIEFLEEVKPDVVTLCSFVPIPGSDIFDFPEKYEGKMLVDPLDFERFDFSLKWEKNSPFGFLPNGMSLEDLESNREKLKRYIFNNNLSNVFKYNREYA